MSTEQDHIHLYGDSEPSPKWVAWKAAHPEAFGARRATRKTAR